MNKLGKIIFFIGVTFTVVMGLIVSLDPGFVCGLDTDNLPKTIWSYQVLCFIFWAFSVPAGIIVAAIGILIFADAKRNTILKFGFGTLGTYVFISFANGPMPHVPILFGIGGTLILLFYFMILWKNVNKLKENAFKLSGYTFLLIGLWSDRYNDILCSGNVVFLVR